MTPRQQRPSQPSTEKKWAAATSRSTKPDPRASARHAATAAEGASALVAVAADSRTRITASPHASRANRAGNVLARIKAASKETDEHYVPKTPEGTKAAGKTKGEGCQTRAEKSRETGRERNASHADDSADRCNAGSSDWERITVSARQQEARRLAATATLARLRCGWVREGGCDG